MSQTRKPRGIHATDYGLHLLKREKANIDLTYQEIADRAERDEKTVKRFFSGKPVEPSSASKIVQALHLPLEHVVDLERSVIKGSIEDLQEENKTLKQMKAAQNREIQQLQVQGNASVSEIKGLEDKKADLGMKVKLSEENIDALKEYARKFEERMNISKQAAEWLKAHKESLVKEAVEVLNKNYLQEELDVSVDSLDELKQDFSQDIKRCLKLVYHCLQYGSYNLLYKAIMQAKVTPHLNYKIAYVEAFELIKEQRAARELPVGAAKELTYYLDLLTTLIPTLS